MKVMTIGWLSVFFLMLLMNLYIWNFNWKIPFSKGKILKLMNYSIVHLALAIVSIHYFYLFFNERTDGKQTKILSYIAGFYLTFLHYSMLFLLIHDLVYWTRNKFPYPRELKLLGSRLFFGGLLIYAVTALISLYSIYNGQHLEVKDYNIKIRKKDSKLNSLNLVYISDGHIGTSVNRENIDELVKKIEKLEPEILILGGDFLDEGTTEKDRLVVLEKISKIETQYGIFAIEGNHEYKSGNTNIDDQMDYYRRQGIKVLQDEVYRVDDNFYLIGRKDSYGNLVKLEDLTEKVKEKLPIMLLDHRPSFKEAEKNDMIDLQLSGHTHSGQFFPIQIFNPLAKRFSKSYIYGYHRVGNLQHIVSSGIGNWGIPVRLGSRREVLNIRIDFI